MALCFTEMIQYTSVQIEFSYKISDRKMVDAFALVKEEFMIPVTLNHVLQTLPVSEQSFVTSTAIAPSNLYLYIVKLNRVLCIVDLKQHPLITQSSFTIR